MSEPINELVGWKWLTTDRRPIIWPQSEEHPPFNVDKWMRRQPGAGPFSVFRNRSDALRFGAFWESQTNKWELWEIKWTPCYSLSGPTRVYGRLLLWRQGLCGDADPLGEPLQDLPMGTCLADAVMLVRRVPKDQVLRGMLDVAYDERKLWSRRFEYWRDEAVKQDVAVPAYYSAAPTATQPTEDKPAQK